MRVLVFLLGDKLLDRLRSATFAMLGVVTAIGLILVALVLQQGWPSVFGGPLPGFSNGPPADEAVSAAPGSFAGGAAPAPQSGAGGAPPRSGSGSGGGDSAGSRGAGRVHDVVASTPVSSAPADPEPVVEATPEPQAPAAAVPPPASAPAATSAPSTGAPAASAGDDGDKVLANAKGRSPSRGAAASKPKSSAPKSKAPGSKAPAPVEEASVEAKLPPVSVPSEEEADPLPVEEKDEQDSGHGYGKSKGK